MSQEKPSFWSFENLRSLSVLVLIIFAIRWSVASPYHVPTASMEPTIKVGDRLLAFKLAYEFKFPFTDWVVAKWAEVERGDIIVFKYPRDTSIDYVKRVVAIAGDQVELRDNVLYLNDEMQQLVDHNEDRSVLDDIEDNAHRKLLFREKLGELDHWVIRDKTPRFRFSRGNWPPAGRGAFTVPEGSVFVVGDNRDNSTDSREWGQVPLEYVRGKALFVIWSVYTPPGSNWWSMRFGRFGEWLY